MKNKIILGSANFDQKYGIGKNFITKKGYIFFCAFGAIYTSNPQYFRNRDFITKYIPKKLTKYITKSHNKIKENNY